MNYKLGQTLVINRKNEKSVVIVTEILAEQGQLELIDWKNGAKFLLYLMVHELCHRRHMNHSQRYWRLVESFEPGWRALDAELLRGWQHVPAWVFPH